jgi:outer membrane lipopolysaccharide assembly protein LptE/RlpB
MQDKMDVKQIKAWLRRNSESRAPRYYLRQNSVAVRHAIQAMMDATIEPTRKSESDTTTSISKQVDPAGCGE